MYSSSPYLGLALGLHIHYIFGGVLIFGAVLFAIWASKNLDKKALKNWALWLILAGLVGTLLTGGWGMRGWQNMMGNQDEEWGGEMLEEMEEYMDLNLNQKS